MGSQANYHNKLNEMLGSEQISKGYCLVCWSFWKNKYLQDTRPWLYIIPLIIWLLAKKIQDISPKYVSPKYVPFYDFVAVSWLLLGVAHSIQWNLLQHSEKSYNKVCVAQNCHIFMMSMESISSTSGHADFFSLGYIQYFRGISWSHWICKWSICFAGSVRNTITTTVQWWCINIMKW